MTMEKISNNLVEAVSPTVLGDRLRQCVTCRQLIPRSRLIRLVRDCNGLFALDGNPPLQGRSAYVCRTSECLSEAIRARKFQRTLKRGIPDAIVESLKARLKGLSSS